MGMEEVLEHTAQVSRAENACHGWSMLIGWVWLLKFKATRVARACVVLMETTPS
jgi:hypothetical protein